MKTGFALILLTLVPAISRGQAKEADKKSILVELDSPILLRGNDTAAYRDPAVLYHENTFYLFCTLVQTDQDRRIYSYTVQSESKDLRSWSEPKIITPKGQKLNYSSPGNVVRFQGEWVLCLQTYPRPHYKRGDKLSWANRAARLFVMRSKDLRVWSEPELLRVMGPDIPQAQMGRMIDPYLLQDKDDPTRWWCFFKQDGVSYSWSRDLKNWKYAGHTASGENVCVLVQENEYLLFHSPHNGIGVMRSSDLKGWTREKNVITLGQSSWRWAENRLTAGAVLDLRDEPSIGKYLMFFHGGGQGKKKTQHNVDANCSIGIAWSDDLTTWEWPGKSTTQPSPAGDSLKVAPGGRVGAQIKANRMKHLMVAASIITAISLPGCKETEANRSLKSSVRILQAAKTANELDKAVGDLGIVLTFPDGTWMAIRYVDRHEPEEAFFSLAVARDSEDGWFYSDYHFCGYLAAYRHTIMGEQGLTEADIDTNFEGIHAVATSPDLATARKNLKALNLRTLKR